MELGVEGFRVYGLQMQSFEHRAFFSGFRHRSSDLGLALPRS